MNKPLNLKINLDGLKAAELEYYCSTLEIDREVFKALKIPFDEELAAEREKYMKFYFVVLSSGQYDVIRADHFEAWLKKTRRLSMSASWKVTGTDLSTACMAEFTASLIEGHKKAINERLREN